MKSRSFPFLCAAVLASLLAGIQGKAVDFKVDYYTGFTPSGDGSPFSGLAGSYSMPWIYEGSSDLWLALPTGTLGDVGFHPGGLPAFGTVLTGYFTAPSFGSYFFGTYSDDGSRMYIDGSLVVENGGAHGPYPVITVASLSAGVHTMTVNFFEDFGGASLLEAYIDGRLAPVSASVPEGGTTLALIGVSFLGLSGLRRRL